MFKLTMNKINVACHPFELFSFCQSLVPPHLPAHTSSQGTPGDFSFEDWAPVAAPWGNFLCKTTVTSICTGGTNGSCRLLDQSVPRSVSDSQGWVGQEHGGSGHRGSWEMVAMHPALAVRKSLQREL